MINKKPQLSFRQIANINDFHFEKALAIYDESFPSNEKHPLSLIKKRVTEKTSSLHVGLLNEKVVCMALLWDFKDLEFVLLDYMAVDKEHRNKKVGAIFFKYLSDIIKTYNKYIIIETENYLFGNNKELRKKRINFYVKNGAFILRDIPYILPSLDDTVPTEMFLMISPRFKEDYMDFEKIEKLIKSLYIDLYDKTENDALLISILKNTPKKISQNNDLIS